MFSDASSTRILCGKTRIIPIPCNRMSSSPEKPSTIKGTWVLFEADTSNSIFFGLIRATRDPVGKAKRIPMAWIATATAATVSVRFIALIVVPPAFHGFSRIPRSDPSHGRFSDYVNEYQGAQQENTEKIEGDTGSVKNDTGSNEKQGALQRAQLAIEIASKGKDQPKKPRKGE